MPGGKAIKAYPPVFPKLVNFYYPPPPGGPGIGGGGGAGGRSLPKAAADRSTPRSEITTTKTDVTFLANRMFSSLWAFL